MRLGTRSPARQPGVVRAEKSEPTLHRSSRLGLHVSQLYFAVGPKVSVNAICPGIIATDLLRGLLGHREVELTAGIAMGRVGTPEDVASIVRYLAVEAHLFMTGHHFVVDGFQWGC